MLDRKAVLYASVTAAAVTAAAVTAAAVTAAHNPFYKENKSRQNKTNTREYLCIRGTKLETLNWYNIKNQHGNVSNRY